MCVNLNDGLPSRTRHPTPPYQPTARAPSVPAPPDGAVSLRHSPTAFVALVPDRRLPTRIITAQYHPSTPHTPFPPSTPPALSPSEHMQIDHATIPAHTHLSCRPVSLLCEIPLSSVGTHNPGLSSSPGEKETSVHACRFHRHKVELLSPNR